MSSAANDFAETVELTSCCCLHGMPKMCDMELEAWSTPVTPRKSKEWPQQRLPGCNWHFSALLCCAETAEKTICDHEIEAQVHGETDHDYSVSVIRLKDLWHAAQGPCQAAPSQTC